MARAEETNLLRETRVALGHTHDSCIVPKDIESALLGEERLCAGFDGGQVGQVELQELEPSLGVGMSRLDGLDRVQPDLLAAAGNVHGCVCGVEDLGELVAYA